MSWLKKNTSHRIDHLKRLYELLDILETRVGGKFLLHDSDGRMGWPKQGLYLFFENGEERSESGKGPRIVRVGTHAVSDGSKTTLWNRISQHKGIVKSGGGNHRGSIFRLIVGEAIQQKDPTEIVHSWGKGSSAPKDIRDNELPLECAVSDIIRSMPFLFIDVPGISAKDNDRSLLEQNLIGLLSNYDRETLDPPSPNWLGRSCPRNLIQCSGLWNSQHVEKGYTPDFLDLLEKYILNTTI
ncbi:MAG: hypothetical protein CL942_00870 [Desulfovibrio sp.]|nr:hypothetical protein [Desulfovibrio sp.]